MSFQQHGSMRVVNCCLFGSKKSDAWDPAWFLPDYHTRKLRNEPFFFSGENPGKPQIRNNGATIRDHQPKMLCAFNKVIEAGKMEEREEARELRNAHSLTQSLWLVFFSSFSLINLFFFSVFCFFPFPTNANTPIPIQNKINWRRQGPVWVSPVISVLWFFMSYKVTGD